MSTPPSVREIALRSGFSPAAIYLFFDNKQHLLSETLTPRGAELVAVLQGVADTDAAATDKLHAIVDATITFFEARPHFRRMLRFMTGGTPIVGPSLATYASQAESHFTKAMKLMATIISEGQQAGEIREGDPNAIAHLYSVLVNEYVLLAADASTDARTLTPAQFHAIIDGALRQT